MINLNIKGAKELYLEVSDGGNGTSYDWANWAEPRLVGPKGELKLTSLKWKALDGRAKVNKNQGGGPLKIDGKPVEYGIGTHAKSLIVYALPRGYTRFRAPGSWGLVRTRDAGKRRNLAPRFELR